MYSEARGACEDARWAGEPRRARLYLSTLLKWARKRGCLTRVTWLRCVVVVLAGGGGDAVHLRLFHNTISGCSKRLPKNNIMLGKVKNCMAMLKLPFMLCFISVALV